MSEYQKVRLQAAHGPDTHFEGMLVHSYSTQNREGSKSRWTELRLWKTPAGNWVTESVGCSTHGNEREIREVTVIDSHVPAKEVGGRLVYDPKGGPAPERIMAAWGWTTAAKAFARELGWDVIRRVE